MKTIQNISAFQSSFDVFLAHFPQIVHDMDRDHARALLHLDDYEARSFVVINEGTVMVYDTISGDVYGQFDSLEEFRDLVLEEIEVDL